MADREGSPDRVWDAPTRWFHWINVVLVSVLAASGFFFMYREAFNVSGGEAKMALKSAHAWVGYAFVINLVARFVWAFRGNRYARWRAIVPDRAALREIGAELSSLVKKERVKQLVRSPVSRLSATIMFAVMALLAVTGLVRAATDLYHLPAGPVVASLVARPGVDPSAINWRTEATLGDRDRLRLIAKVKTLAGQPHTWASWLMVGLIVLHIAGAVLTEIRQQSGLISTMVSGRPPPESSRQE